jgi:protein-S-isoprenylcysteine O-methyltransferase Ste14
MARGVRELTAFAVALTAATLGAGSLVIFAAFLWTGAFGLVDLAMTERGKVVFDSALCLVFFLQHSVMVRRGFRIRLQKWLPEYWSGVIYTIASAFALLVLVGAWQRSNVQFYVATATERWLLGTVLLLALAGVLWGIRSLGDFDAFGIRKLLAEIRGGAAPRTVLTINGPYRVVRHPFYAFAIVALWAAPVLSLDRAVLNIMFTLWIAVGATLEERDLVSEFGEAYRNYQRMVPMFVPCVHARRWLAYPRVNSLQ